jgi:hypothetical protein
MNVAAIWTLTSGGRSAAGPRARRAPPWRSRGSSGVISASRRLIWRRRRLRSGAAPVRRSSTAARAWPAGADPPCRSSPSPAGALKGCEPWPGSIDSTCACWRPHHRTHTRRTTAGDGSPTSSTVGAKCRELSRTPGHDSESVRPRTHARGHEARSRRGVRRHSRAVGASWRVSASNRGPQGRLRALRRPARAIDRGQYGGGAAAYRRAGGGSTSTVPQSCARTSESVAAASRTRRVSVRSRWTSSSVPSAARAQVSPSGM